VNEFTAMPPGPDGPVAVMTTTPVAKQAIARRTASLVTGAVSIRRLTGRSGRRGSLLMARTIGDLLSRRGERDRQ
jgi:hypothetical protein